MGPVLITEKTNDVITYFEVDKCKTGFFKKKKRCDGLHIFGSLVLSCTNLVKLSVPSLRKVVMF